MGLIRWRQEPPILMKHYTCEVLAWEIFDNYAGVPCRVPQRWVGTQRGEVTEFVYEAKRNSEPRKIFGQGFLYGFDYQGQMTGALAPSVRMEGSGYVEHLGFAQK